MRNKIGTACMVLGTLLVLAALSLFLWNQWENRRAGDSAEDAMSKIIGQIEMSDSDEIPDPYDDIMTEVEIDGYAYIGYLSIPVVNLELPVMSKWDYVRLKVAPCRYSGSVKTGNLVIAAHNYAEHFGPLSKLTEGDRVYFTDMDGIHYIYEVAALDILSSDDAEKMSDGKYDLTLFTCTYSGRNRVTVRCRRVTEK